jgi:hypothetical protein
MATLTTRMPDTEYVLDASAHPHRGYLMAAALLFAAGLASAALLGSVPLLRSEQVQGLAQWRSTPWGWWFGAQVLWVLAMLFALGVVAALRAASRRGRYSSSAWGTLICVACLSAGIGLWYMGVLIAIVGALRGNTWCLIPLGLGMLASLLVFASLPQGIGSFASSQMRCASGVGPTNRLVRRCGLIGLLGTGLLSTGQIAGHLPARAQELVLMLDLRKTMISGEGADRVLLPDGGTAMLHVSQMPLLGSPTAPYLLFTFFDYTDPGSWVTYRSLRQARARYGDQLAILPIVFPLDQSNPRVPGYIAAGHGGATEYARLALAVWLADAGKFELFHDYLMTPRSQGKVYITKAHITLPPLAEATACAEELVGKEVLDRARRDPRIDEHLRLCIAAKGTYTGASPTGDFQPQTVWAAQSAAPGARGVRGPIKTLELLAESLESSTGIRPVRSGSPNSSLMQLLNK